MRLVLVVGVCTVLGACHNPTTPSRSVWTVEPCGDKPWPQPDPRGGYGQEDPRYPPRLDQCGAGYYPGYNGNNWVCRGDVGQTEMPRRAIR